MMKKKVKKMNIKLKNNNRIKKRLKNKKKIK